MTEFIKNNRVYRQYPCFFPLKIQNKYISENNASIRLRRWTKKLNTDLTEVTDLAFSLIFLGGERYWIYLWISVDS